MSHGLHRTLSSPDEPQANGRVEAAVGWVKRKARALCWPGTNPHCQVIEEVLHGAVERGLGLITC